MRTRSDPLLMALDSALKTLSGGTHASRPLPQATTAETVALSPAQRRLSGALMRVNHVGEVCAQALYQAQGLGAHSAVLKTQMGEAAREEADHLAWTEQRLAQLGAHRSWLNPLWYVGAFAIGLVAARSGDGVSLGFVKETERQVEGHLASHLQRLPAEDLVSRAIVEQMKVDEARHAEQADALGATPLPRAVTWLMRRAAAVMTTTAHYI
jgi:ubiquinone biosynthesis monooxygenase Coq7